MKGKHGAAAQVRRDWAELTDRAERAERERDKIAAELAALRQDAARDAEALRAQVRAVCAERDQAEGPRVADLNGENVRLRSRIADLAGEINRRQKANESLVYQLLDLHEEQGMSRAQAFNLVAERVDPEKMEIGRRAKHKTGPEVVKKLQREEVAEFAERLLALGSGGSTQAEGGS